jgi:GDP-fucose transporter C1
MSAAANKEIRKNTLHSALAVGFYMTVSIGLVFLNRVVLTDKTEKAGALFVSWYQFVVAYVIIVIITTFCPCVPLLNLFPRLSYRPALFVKVIPVSAAYLLMVGFNNKCLEFVSVSSYQIVRSLTIVFNIILTYLVLGQTTSLRAMIACGGVVAGFFIGVEGEIDLLFRGAVYGVASSVFVVSYSVAVKRVMELMDNNEYLLIEYNTPVAIVALAPFVWYAGEFRGIADRSARFWAMQTLAGLVGFIINIAIFLNIKYTTPLTHNLSGTVKACVQTLLAFFIFPGSEVMTKIKFLGTVLVIGFSAYYARVRQQEMKKKISKEIAAAPEVQSNADKNELLEVGATFEPAMEAEDDKDV